MYRQSLLKQDTMSGEVAIEQQNNFINKVSSLPVVVSAVGQLSEIYSHTKERNRLFKYTLESAEKGVKFTLNVTSPVVGKIAKPVDRIACTQLDKLEQSYPVIAKPTDQVLKETQGLYNKTLKPQVDKVAAVAQYGADKYNFVKDLGVNTFTEVKDFSANVTNNVKQYSVGTVTGVTKYGVDTVTGVTKYGVDTVTGVTKYGVDTVTGVTKYGVDTVTGVTKYSSDKAAVLLATAYGKAIAAQVDNITNITDQYVDKYLPSQEEQQQGSKPSYSPTESTPDNSLVKLGRVGDKVRVRMYNRAMKQVGVIKERSRETLDNLNFTVDLIGYAKSVIDKPVSVASEKYSASKDKLQYFWTEINKNEESVTATNEGSINNVTFEQKAIATGRHLTNKIKRSFAAVSVIATSLPSALADKFNSAKLFVENLHHNFSMASSFNDISQRVLDESKERISYIQNALNFTLEYIATTSALSRMLPPLLRPSTPALDESKSEKENMEPPKSKSTLEEQDSYLMETPSSSLRVNVSEGQNDAPVFGSEPRTPASVASTYRTSLLDSDNSLLEDEEEEEEEEEDLSLVDVSEDNLD